MQFQFKTKIGQTEFTISDSAETPADFFEKVSFFSTLPTEGPNGEDDLELVHRTTKEGFNYYSIVSRAADKEYKFGQSQKKPGELFGKGWEQLYHGNGARQQQPQNNSNMNSQQVSQEDMPQMQQLPNQAPQANTSSNQQSQTPPPQQNQNQSVADDVLSQFGIK